MSKVLKADGSSADAWVEVEVAAQTDIWVTFTLSFSAAALALWLSGSAGFLATLFNAGHSGYTDYVSIDVSGWETSTGTFASPATAIMWQEGQTSSTLPGA